MEGLAVADANLVVYLHPSQIKNVSRAILRELSSLLFKYSETFDGVVLAYGANAPEKNARILSGIHPYIGVRLSTNLLIFSPKPDMLLEGKVVKVSRESVHVIVLGFASAIITEEDIRNEFKYKSKRGEGLLVSKSQKRHVIKIGTAIRFLVKSLDEEVLHMSGSLIPAHTGSIRWLGKKLQDLETESGTRKRSQTDGELEVQERGTTGGEGSLVTDDYKAKKSKKRKTEDH